MKRVIESKYFENTKANHFKFYEVIETVDNGVFEVVGVYGRIGSSSKKDVKYRGVKAERAAKALAEVTQTRFNHGYELLDKKSA